MLEILPFPRDWRVVSVFHIAAKRESIVLPAGRGKDFIFQEPASPLDSAYFPSEVEASTFGK